MLSTLQSSHRTRLVTLLPLHHPGHLQHPLLGTHTVELVPQAKEAVSVADHDVGGEGDGQAVDHAAGERWLKYNEVHT